jgi:outer membrane lipoprotein LolB
VAALFDWLAGFPSVADGWQADLSGRAEGRLRARRLTAPAADLRIVLHTP